jgi:putative SOS response-associated peptidase YedK
LLLQSDTADRWLAGDDEVIQDVAANSPALQAWPVARTVNNARNEGEQLIIRQDPSD